VVLTAEACEECVFITAVQQLAGACSAGNKQNTRM
jgi:hypothetical protein